MAIFHSYVSSPEGMVLFPIKNAMTMTGAPKLRDALGETIFLVWQTRCRDVGVDLSEVYPLVNIQKAIENCHL